MRMDPVQVLKDQAAAHSTLEHVREAIGKVVGELEARRRGETIPEDPESDVPPPVPPAAPVAERTKTRPAKE